MRVARCPIRRQSPNGLRSRWSRSWPAALVGLLMAVLLKQLKYLAFIALSPMMVIGNAS